MTTINNAAGSLTADVNTDLEVLVALSKVLAKAGYGVMAGELHDGSTGMAALRRSPVVSIQKRLAVGVDTMLWEDVFHHATFNTSRYLGFETTATKAVAGGFLTLNSGASVASGASCLVRTFRSIPILANAPTTVDIWASLALTPVSQSVLQFGVGLPNSTTPYAPTDGVYVELDSAGVLQLQCNYNGTSTGSGAIAFSWVANQVYHFQIVIHADRAELFIDGVLRGAVARLAAGAGLSQSTSGMLFARFNNAAATSSAQKLNISRWCASSGDLAQGRPWASQQGVMGNNCVNAPDGSTPGGTANIVNSTAPTTGTPTNTTAGYTTLGGNWQIAAAAGAETDLALFAYQVPVPAIGQPAKTFVLTGWKIETWNTVVPVATSGTVLNWYSGVGATAVSLATADSATAGTRAPRKQALGTQTFPVGAAVGAAANTVDYTFAEPQVCEAGTFVHVILRMPIGTATATEIYRGTVTPKGYWE